MPHTLSAFLVLLIETQWECEERTLSLHALLPRTGTTKKSVYALKMLNERWLCKALRYRVRSGEWGQASFFSSLVTWVHRHLDPVLDVIISLEESTVICLSRWGHFPSWKAKGPGKLSLLSPSLKSGAWNDPLWPCVFLTCLTSSSELPDGRFLSAWDNLFICLCILPGKYLFSTWCSFRRDSWGTVAAYNVTGMFDPPPISAFISDTKKHGNKKQLIPTPLPLLQETV